MASLSRRDTRRDPRTRHNPGLGIVSVIRLSGDYCVGVAGGCPVWMMVWQAWQTTRVLRRRLAISVIHVGRSGCPGLSRSASLRM